MFNSFSNCNIIPISRNVILVQQEENVKYYKIFVQIIMLQQILSRYISILFRKMLLIPHVISDFTCVAFFVSRAVLRAEYPKKDAAAAQVIYLPVLT